MRRLLMSLLCLFVVWVVDAHASHTHSTRAQQSLEELIGGSGRIEVISVLGRAAPAVSPTSYGRIYFDSGTNTFQASQNGGAYVMLVGAGGSAPANATYITQTAHAGLSAEQALSALSTGLMNVTTTTGAITSIANVAAGQVLISGTPAAWSAAPTLTTSLTNPLLIGGTATTSTLTLRSTSGVGAAGADIVFQTGNNGATEAMRILNNSNITMKKLQVDGGAGIAIDVANAIDQTTYLSAHSGNFYIQSQDSNTVTEMNVTNRNLRLFARSGWMQLGTDGTNYIYLNPGGNLGIFTTSFGTTANKVIAIGAGTAPSTSPADVFQIYGCDIAGAGTFGGCFRDEGGNVYKIGNGQISGPDGSATLPTFSFVADTDTGIYRPAIDVLAVLGGGVPVVRLGNGSIGTTADVIINGGGALGFGTGAASFVADTVLVRDAANTFAQRNGVNAQTFRSYGTFTDASNYERAALSATIGTGITLAAETAGTGGDNLSVTLTPAGTGNVLAALNAGSLFQVGSTLRFAVTDGAAGTGTRVRTAQATAPTCTTNCGTSPSVSGSDTAMVVTLGTGTPASPITVTFNGTWATAPACHAANRTTAGNYVTRADSTTTTAVVYFAAGPTASDLLAIACLGVS